MTLAFQQGHDLVVTLLPRPARGGRPVAPGRSRAARPGGRRCTKRTLGVTIREQEGSILDEPQGLPTAPRGGKWVADRKQQTAAWEMYVELITRISVQPLGAEEGLLREALSSLYSLFGETRRILKQHGPGVARPLSGGEVAFGILAVRVLNQLLRPLLAKWHPLLQAHEVSRPAEIAPSAHERSWEHHDELRRRIEEVRSEMLDYADLLAQVAGVRAIHGTGAASPRV